MAAATRAAEHRERADVADRAAGLAWRAGDLDGARRLIADARALDPARAGLWARREAAIATAEAKTGGNSPQPSRAASRVPSGPREPRPGTCPDCRSAQLTHGRTVCQACGALRIIREREAEAGQ